MMRKRFKCLENERTCWGIELFYADWEASFLGGIKWAIKVADKQIARQIIIC